MHAALDAGVTLIDTADVYCLDQCDIGHNERLVAEALRSWHVDARGDVIVATKGGWSGPVAGGRRTAGPSTLRAACERSLAALGVERIDLYQLHAPDPQVPLEESVGALAEFQREGKIRWVGLSNVSVAQIERAQAIVSGPHGAEPAEPVLPGGALVREWCAYCAEPRDRFPGLQPDRRRPAQPQAARRTRSSAPMAARLGASAHALVLAWVLASHRR